MKILFIIHDHDKKTNDFPLGPAYIISYLKAQGWDEKNIDIYNMDVYHYSFAELAQHLRSNRYDLVGIGAIAGYWQFKQVLGICKAIKSIPSPPRIVLGGQMTTPEPEYFIRKMGADYVVMGEGEIVFANLVKALAEGKSAENVKGLAYRVDDEVVINDRGKPIRDLDSLPFPAWHKFPMENYVLKSRFPIPGRHRVLPVISSRGCAYHCSFCYRMEKGYRTRSIDSVMEEVKKIVHDYALKGISFRDELLMITPERATEFAERILAEQLDIVFEIDGRLNAVTPDVLKLLKRAGCVYINYGVESLDQNVLDQMNKQQTIEEIIRGVELTVKADINPGLNVIFGNIGDNEKTAKKTVEFLLKYNTHAEIRTLKPVTPYPGSPLYYKAIELGLLEGCADFYENKHLNSDLMTANFTELSDEDFYKVIYEANRALLEDHFNHLLEKSISAHRRLYFQGDTSFRGVRV